MGTAPYPVGRGRALSRNTGAFCVVRFVRSGLEVSAEPGLPLLEVAEHHGIALGSLCRGGTCGTCKARLISGRPEIHADYALSAKERLSGWVLTCAAHTVAGERIVLDL